MSSGLSGKVENMYICIMHNFQEIKESVSGERPTDKSVRH